MRKAILILVFILLAANSIAPNEDLIYRAEEVRTRLTISSDFDILKTSSAYKVSYVAVNLSFVPIEREGQQILDINYDPEPSKSGKDVLFTWDDDKLGEYSFLLESELYNKVNLKEVKGKIKFPIQDLDGGYEIYTRATGNIDSEDPEIIKKASEIAGGQDDLYVVVFELVKWIKNNIEYSLNTLTADVSQKSSWVLENGYGVCDEITSLFVSMARSLGIPARYISGMAYTNWNDLNDWGPHAWAEVYFPGYGWVGFDITYREFGYVDASHIVLRESLDSDESATHYEWRGRNIDLDANELEIGVELLGKKGDHGGTVKIDVALLKDEIGFGSYNLVEAEIENLKDYYVAEEFGIANVDEVIVEGEGKKQVLLKPREKKKIHWIIKIGDDLNDKYIYTIPIKIYTPRNTSAESEFVSSGKSKVYTENDMKDILEQISDEEKKSYSREVELECMASDNRVYIDEELEVSCTIKNKGNVLLEGINVCLDENCEDISLGISQEKELSFIKDPEAIGKRELSATARSVHISKASYVEYEVLDDPAIEISELQYPSQVGYGEEFSVSFILDKTSFSNPKDIVVTLVQNGVPQKWEIKELNNSEEFVVNINSDVLGGGENRFEVKVDYMDERDGKYSVDDSFVIDVKAEKLFDKIKLLLNDMEYFFRRVFSKLFK